MGPQLIILKLLLLYGYLLTYCMATVAVTVRLIIMVVGAVNNHGYDTKQ